MPVFIFLISFHRTLEPHQVTEASAYNKLSLACEKSSISDWKKPEWRQEYNCGRQYTPSYNLAPSDISPVLVSARHFDEDSQSSDRIVVPMLWGMIPRWHTGDYRKHGLTTNNCRFETMLQSKLYKHAFEKGQRCVVLCEGFYEWQTTNPNASKSSERAAYYIYMPQIDKIEIENRVSWEKAAKDLNLLKMAGLFDVWTDSKGNNIYSYSVVTFESNETLSWLHHRSPAILETDKQIADWLDYERITDSKYLCNMIKPINQLKWHRVSNIVNNAKNKSEQCNKKIDEKVTKTTKNKIMKSWLIVKKRKMDDEE